MDCLRSSNINKIPDFLLYELNYNELKIDLLHIKNTSYKPYFLLKDKNGSEVYEIDHSENKIIVRAGIIYTRDNASLYGIGLMGPVGTYISFGGSILWVAFGERVGDAIVYSGCFTREESERVYNYEHIGEYKANWEIEQNEYMISTYGG